MLATKDINEVIGKQKALLVSITLYVSAVTGLFVGLSSVLDRWPFSPTALYVFLILPVLIGIVRIVVPRTRRRQMRQMLRDIGVQAPFKPGIFRTGPFERDNLYVREDGAHLDVHRKLKDALNNARPFFLLHSLSGCGKTSLIEAFLVPELQKEGYTVQQVRGYTGILKELSSNMGVAANSTVEVLYDTMRESAKKNCARIIVIDQFEEFLVLFDENSDERKAFCRLVDLLKEKPLEGLIILISLRTEYRTAALDLGIPDFDLRWSSEVPLFTAAIARSFLKRGLRDTAGEVQLDEFVRQMEDRDETPGLVRPIRANLVGYAYETFAGEFHQRLLHGRRIDILLEWLHRLFRRPHLRFYAPKTLQFLMRPDGGRKPATVEQIASGTTFSPSEVRGCLSALEQFGLVRCLTPDLKEEQKKIWEITHDFLALQIRRALSFWRRMWYERLFAGMPSLLFGVWVLTVAIVLFTTFGVSQNEFLHSHGLTLSTTDDGRRKSEVSVIQGEEQKFTDRKLTTALSTIRQLNCTSLVVQRCPQLTGQNLLAISTLKRVDFGYCERIETADSLKGSASLEEVHLGSCKSLCDIKALDTLLKLKVLNLSSCPSLINLAPLGSINHVLDDIDFGNNTWEDLSRLPKLKTKRINFAGTTKLKNLKLIENCEGLEKLDISGCELISDLKPLYLMKSSLIELVARGCRGVPDTEWAALREGNPQLNIIK